MTSVRRAVWLLGVPVRWPLLGAIRLYQLTLSGVMGGQCRFSPTCSYYAAQAIKERGALVGAALAVWRILRCNPFGQGGPDPVPPRRMYDHDTLTPPLGARGREARV